MEKAKSALKRIGLTAYEAKVYIALTKLQKAKASRLKEEANIPYSKIYETAEKLENKDLIKTINQKPKKYELNEPKKSLEKYVDKKIKKIRENKTEALNHVDNLLDSQKITAIVLAAGKVKEKDKLLMKLGSKTVIEHVLGVLNSSKVDEIILVLGYKPERIKDRIGKNNRIKIVEIDNFDKGFTHSFQVGLKEAMNSEAILLTLGDQPFLDTKFLNELINKAKSKEGEIISPVYEGKLGHPVIFSEEVYEDLLNLEKNQTIRKVIKEYEKNLITVQGGNWTLLDIDSLT